MKKKTNLLTLDITKSYKTFHFFTASPIKNFSFMLANRHPKSKERKCRSKCDKKCLSFSGKYIKSISADKRFLI